MTDSRPPRFHWPSALSVFAGILGAGVIDALAVLLRGQHARFFEAFALALGLFGATGLLVAAAVGFAVAVVLGALPGGLRGLDDETVDANVCGVLLGGSAGALVLAVGVGLGHKAMVASMNSQTLATIASAGIGLLMTIPAALTVLASWRGCARLSRRLPRPRRLPRTGLLVIGLVVLGLLAFVAALSRADWRVLDLGPLWSAAIAALLALGHAVFWHGSALGRRLAQKLPGRILRPVVAAGVLLLLLAASRIGDASPTFAAVSEGGLGGKLALKLARRFADRDGDGYAARFGGGDCDDGRADVFPGGDDVPGDGIDQNCEGGDAAPVATAPAGEAAAKAPAAPTVKPRSGAGVFQGNLLIVAVDATRADRLGVAGYGRPAGQSLTPNLDALAKRGAYFRRVWAQAPNTPRSFPSFVTSRYPSRIAWERKTHNYSPLSPSNHTFFEPFAGAGWKNIGIFSHFYFTADRGISKGFAEWSNDGAKSIADSNKDIASPRIVPRVIDRIKKAAANRERFVLWTHLFEPHSSYMSHPEFPTTLTGVQGLEEKYDYEIAFADRWIGKILKTLDETGLTDNTAIVAFGDHGEAWGEHNRVYFHGQNLTEEQIRVPLIFAIPGRAPVVSDAEVGLIDVGPTLLDLVGIVPPPHLQGRSLLPAIDGGSLPPQPVFAELLPSTATPDHHTVIVDRGRKLVHKVSDRRFELFDLTADPRQMKNLADDPAHKALLDELKAKLLAHEERR